MSQFPEDKSYLILAYAQAKRQGCQAFRDRKTERDCPHEGSLRLHWLGGFYAASEDQSS